MSTDEAMFKSDGSYGHTESATSVKDMVVFQNSNMLKVICLRQVSRPGLKLVPMAKLRL